MNVCITGANRGLGLALARVFLEQGHQVFATYRQKSKALLDLEQQWKQLIPIPCDVTDEAQIHSLQQMLRNKAGSLDILVHNQFHRRNSISIGKDSFYNGELRRYKKHPCHIYHSKLAMPLMAVTGTV
jgi:NAD(P)-dependent dehydrogenase (short-subunit alcohol dehydrogenase family)